MLVQPSPNETTAIAKSLPSVTCAYCSTREWCYSHDYGPQVLPWPGTPPRMAGTLPAGATEPGSVWPQQHLGTVVAAVALLLGGTVKGRSPGGSRQQSPDLAHGLEFGDHCANAKYTQPTSYIKLACSHKGKQLGGREFHALTH